MLWELERDKDIERERERGRLDTAYTTKILTWAPHSSRFLSLIAVANEASVATAAAAVAVVAALAAAAAAARFSFLDCLSSLLSGAAMGALLHLARLPSNALLYSHPSSDVRGESGVSGLSDVI